VSRRSQATIRIPREWSEFLGALVSRKARFLVVGSHALAALGRPRYSGDFDLFVAPDRKNVERVCQALNDFGFGQHADLEWLCTPGNGLMLGVVPMRLDVLTAIDGVSFVEAWRGRISARFEDPHGAHHVVNVIGRAAYLKNKRESGKKPNRAKDLLDIALLEEVDAPPVRATARPLHDYDVAHAAVRVSKNRRPRKR
jgi:hypothetical protein